MSAVPRLLLRSGLTVALAAILMGCVGGAGPVDLAENVPKPHDSPIRGVDLPKPRDYPIHGIDVSRYQGNIDWNAVAGSGVKFVWIKATEGGDRLDEHFQANWTAAKEVGIPRGAYHFVYWCRPPIEEVTWFEKNVPTEDDALPPVLA